MLLAYVPFHPLARSRYLTGNQFVVAAESGDPLPPFARFGESIFASFGGYSTFPHTVHVTRHVTGMIGNAWKHWSERERSRGYTPLRLYIVPLFD